MNRPNRVIPPAALLIAAGAILSSTASGFSFGVAEPENDQSAAHESSLSVDYGEDHWRFDFNTWMWMIGADGSVGVGGRKADVDASFGDILDASDSLFSFSGHFEVGHGRWAGYLDAWYGNLGADGLSGPSGMADIDVTFEQLIVDFGVMYRVYQWQPEGIGHGHRLGGIVDLYGGARYNMVSLEVDPAMLASRSQDEHWVDPIIGARLIHPLSENLHARVNGDIGGFGVGSDFTWSATAVLGYDFTIFSIPATIYGGYRAIGWEYSDGSGADEFEWDVTLHGPILGLSLRF